MAEIALTSFMKGVGFSFSEIMKMLALVGFSFVFQGFILWRIREPLIELFQTIMTAMKSIPEMQKSIADLNKTMQEHIVQTDLRMTTGDERFGKIENEIEAIKAHAGMK